MQVQKVAKTVNIAIDEALKELNTTIDKIEYEILQNASKGFLGFGSKPAKVLVKVKENKKTEDIKEDNNKIELINNNSNKIEKKIPRMVTDESFKTEKSNNQNNPEEKFKNINKNAPEVAVNFLKEVLNLMKIDVEIDARINEKNHLLIDLNGKDIGVIIGKRGQTLDSLQYLTNLVVNKGEYSYMSVNIDTENYRERRKQTLENLAINLAKKAKKIKRSINLEPMNPYERRIIHAKLQGDNSIKTYSEGDEPFRYVVITPK